VVAEEVYLLQQQISVINQLYQTFSNSPPPGRFFLATVFFVSFDSSGPFRHIYDFTQIVTTGQTPLTGQCKNLSERENTTDAVNRGVILDPPNVPGTLTPVPVGNAAPFTAIVFEVSMSSGGSEYVIDVPLPLIPQCDNPPT
jgi:hypothetical protein